MDGKSDFVTITITEQTIKVVDAHTAIVRHALSPTMRVVPVAGRDSMLLNLSGAHGPWFTRNIVILTDSAGNTGLGEVPGGEKIRQTLEDARPLIVGQPLGDYNAILNAMRAAFADRDAAAAACRPSTCAPPSTPSPRGIGAARPARPVPRTCRSRACSAKASSAMRSRCWATCSTSATATRPTCLPQRAGCAATPGSACATKKR
jgi:hypothetical protein